MKKVSFISLCVLIASISFPSPASANPLWYRLGQILREGQETVPDMVRGTRRSSADILQESRPIREAGSIGVEIGKQANDAYSCYQGINDPTASHRPDSLRDLCENWARPSTSQSR